MRDRFRICASLSSTEDDRAVRRTTKAGGRRLLANLQQSASSVGDASEWVAASPFSRRLVSLPPTDCPPFQQWPPSPHRGDFPCERHRSKIRSLRGRSNRAQALELGLQRLPAVLR